MRSGRRRWSRTAAARSRTRTMRRTAPVDRGARDSSRWPDEESIICSMGVSPMSTLASSPVPNATAPITRSTPSAPVT